MAFGVRSKKKKLTSEAREVNKKTYGVNSFFFATQGCEAYSVVWLLAYEVATLTKYFFVFYCVMG